MMIEFLYTSYDVYTSASTNVFTQNWFKYLDKGENMCFAIGTEIDNPKSNYKNYTVRPMLVLIILLYMYFSLRGWV